MFEVALIFGHEGETLFWWDPKASAGAIPDSPEMWEFLQANAPRVRGVAHTHPWNGLARPSPRDLLTFKSTDCALGLTFEWMVVTLSEARSYMGAWFTSAGRPVTAPHLSDVRRYREVPCTPLLDLQELRVRSGAP